MTKNPKLIAAIAAVMHYIRVEEEAVQMQAAMSAMQQAAPVSARMPAAAIKPWSMHGRQTQMQMGNLMQMRTFKCH